MLSNLPNYIPIIFGLTTAFTVFFCYFIVSKSSQHAHLANRVLFLLLAWLLFQFGMAYSGISYAVKPTVFLLGGVPLLLLTLWLLLSKKGQAFIDDLPLHYLIFLSIVRIPVEMVLYWLFEQGAVPEIMTFAGRNFDILPGIAAPFVAFLAFKKKGKALIWAWSIIGTILLLSIITHAILSAELPVQQFGFEQPNIAIFHAPFNWLATFVAPMVLLTHFIILRRLIVKKQD